MAARPGQDLLIQAYSGLIAVDRPSARAPGADRLCRRRPAWRRAARDGHPRRLRQEAADRPRHPRRGEPPERRPRPPDRAAHALSLGRLADREKFRRNRNLATWFHEAPYGVYRCADGWLALSLNDPQKLAKALGSAPLAAIAAIDRHDERDRYAAVLADELKDRRFADLVPGLDAQAIWYQRVHAYDELRDDPQIRHNQMFREVPVPGGTATLVNHPEPLRRRGAAAAPAGARDRRGYPRGAGRARLWGGRDRRSVLRAARSRPRSKEAVA